MWDTHKQGEVFSFNLIMDYNSPKLDWKKMTFDGSSTQKLASRTNGNGYYFFQLMQFIYFMKFILTLILKTIKPVT